jgi:hypothetical protein
MSNNIPAVGDRVRFVVKYGKALPGDLGTVKATSPSAVERERVLTFVTLDKGGEEACFDSRLQVVSPKVGDRVEVTSREFYSRYSGLTKGIDYTGKRGTVIETNAGSAGKNVRVAFEGEGRRDDIVAPTSVRILDTVLEPVALPVEVGGRYVVESPVFHRPGGAFGDHSLLVGTDRPKVGDIVTISRADTWLGDHETTTGWRIAPEGLVPAPKFLPGDRVVVGTRYVGTYRRAGNVGTVVPLAEATNGSRRLDHAVLLDSDGGKVWTYAEEDLALYVEPVVEEAPVEPVVFKVGDRVRIVKNILPSGKPGNLGESIVGEEHEVREVGEDRAGRAYVNAGWRLAPESFEMVEAAPVEEAPEFSVGDLVIVAEDFTGSDKYAGRIGTVTDPEDHEGDYAVEFDSASEWSYFKASSLTKAPQVKGATPSLVIFDETALWEAGDYSIPQRFVAGVAEAKPEDYALRLEVSAKAARILREAGYTRNVLGSDVAALAEFLLGMDKRSS